MKGNWFQSATVTLFLLLLSSVVLGEATHREGRRVGLAWERGPKAASYELRFERVRENANPLFFKNKGTVFKGVLKPGEYNFAVRAYDKKGRPGLWSEPQEFKVAPLEVKALSPTHDSSLSSSELPDGKVWFRWERGPGAHSFELSIQSETGGYSETVKTEANEIKVLLPTNQKYTWTVKAITEGDTPGDDWKSPWAFTFSQPTLASSQPQKPKGSNINSFTWTTVKGAKTYSYELFYKEFFTPDWTSLQKKQSTKATTVKLKKNLDPGQYKLTVVAQARGWADSSPASVEFVVKPAERELATIPDEINDKGEKKTPSN